MTNGRASVCVCVCVCVCVQAARCVGSLVIVIPLNGLPGMLCYSILVLLGFVLDLILPPPPPTLPPPCLPPASLPAFLPASPFRPFTSKLQSRIHDNLKS